MNITFFRKLKVQIALYYILSTIGVMLLVGAFLYGRFSGIMIDEALSNVKESVNKSGKYTEMYIQHLEFLSQTIAENEQVLRYISGENTNEFTRGDVLSLINSLIENDENVKSIILVSKDGRVVSNEKDLDMTVSDDMMHQEWYINAIDNDELPFLTSARMQDFTMNKDEWVISISREIINKNNENLGVLLIDVEYKVIDEYLMDLELGSEGYAYILNSKGDVVFHEDPQYFEDFSKKEELLSICEFNQGYTKSNNTLVHKYMLNNADWVLVGVSSLDEIEVLQRQIIRILIFVGGVMLVVMIIGSSYIANRITNPIQKLETTMKDFEEGLKEIEIDEKGCYEAISLSEHYNQMVSRIRTLMDEIKEQQQDIRNYEIKVLHSQINPHFLYNTLDTIVWMAEFNDSEKVIAITKSLANFFRLSLNGGNEMTTIQNEITHVREYLFIQKERYGDELIYSIDVEHCLEEIKVPKIILQPIVENAIYHGIRGLDRTGHIDIVVSVVENHIEFMIKDNGKGFDEEKLAEKVADRKVKLGGVGYKNVDQRMKLYYGENYGVTIQSEIGKGTVVKIIMPIKKL